MSSAQRLPSIIAGALVLPALMFGIADRSQTRRPSMPRTRSVAIQHGHGVAGRAHAAGAARMVVGLHEASAMRGQRLVVCVRRDRGSRRARSGSASGSVVKGAQEEALAVDHGAHVVRILQQVRRDERHVLRIGRAQPDEAARLRLDHDRGDGQAIGVLDQRRACRGRDRRSARRTPGWWARPSRSIGLTKAPASTPAERIGPEPNSLNCRPLRSMRQPTPCR